MGSLVKDEGAVLDAEAFEGAAALAGASGEEPDEEELFVGQAGGGKSGEQRGRPGDWDDGNLMAGAERDEPIAGVADERHAGVAVEGDFGALLPGDDQIGGAGRLFAVVIR